MTRAAPNEDEVGAPDARSANVTGRRPRDPCGERSVGGDAVGEGVPLGCDARIVRNELGVDVDGVGALRNVLVVLRCVPVDERMASLIGGP